MREEITQIEGSGGTDLQELVFAYVHYWWVILVCALAFMGLALAYTNLFVLPRYQSSVTIYVNNSNSASETEYIANSDLTVSQKLVNTYVNIIKSDTVLQKVVDERDLPYTSSQLRGMITASQVDSTEIFNVYVSNTDPEMAAKIANAIAEVAPDEIANFVIGSSTKIIDYAKVPGAPYSPNYTNRALLGFAVGILTAVAFLTIRYLLDVHINDAGDLERMFEYPVLGQIPDIAQARSRSKSSYAKYASEEKTK